VLTASGWKTFPAQVVRKRFALGSTDFQVRVMSLDAPSSPTVFGDRVQVHGWVRGLGKARLQVLTPTGWQVFARIHPTPGGRFTVTVARGTRRSSGSPTTRSRATRLPSTSRRGWLSGRMARSFVRSFRRASRSRCSD